MEVRIVADPEAAGAVVADLVVDLLDDKPSTVLGLATGNTPLPAYDTLIDRCRNRQVSFARAQAFLLDEYVGLAPNDPHSYRSVIADVFTDHVDFADNAVHGIDAEQDDLDAACRAYDAEIEQAGGVDLQILGIGSDGHIGFNEPTSSLASRSRVKTLTARTRADNARFFGNDPDAVPHQVLTQGIGTILAARHLVLVATGEAKAKPVALSVEGPVTAMVPASVLQLHPRTTIVVDEAAATDLRLADYYREAYGTES